MEDLQRFIKGDVDISDETLEKFSHDASIFSVKPAAVISPLDTADVRRLVHHIDQRRRSGQDVSLTPRAGGTCMSGGPLTESYVLNMSKYMRHVGAPDVHARTIKVQGGAMHIDVEKATHPHHLFFAPYTSSRDICGIGGMIGNNASGERSIKYGPTSSNIKKLKVVLADGEAYEFGPLTAKQVAKKKELPNFEGFVYRQMTKLIDDNWNLIQGARPNVKKNAAGYPLWDLWDTQRSHFNLARLFVGSQGTLGVVVEAELKLVPFSRAERMIVVPIKDLSDLAPVVKTLVKFKPEVCETFDYHTYNLAKICHPHDAARASVADGQHMVVFAIYAGDTHKHADEVAEKARQAILSQGKQVAWIDDPEVAESLLLIRRKSFRMLLENPTDNYRAMAFLEDSIVPIEHYGEFLASLEAILKDYNMTYTYAGHIGDGSIRLVPLVNMNDSEAPKRVLDLERRFNDLVVAFGGSISVDHNDGIIRTPFLEMMFGAEMVTLFAKVKDIFDPHNIFNPGKKVGGSFEYAERVMIRGNA